VRYDLLDLTDGVSKAVLLHPAKNRIIADAQIKTIRISLEQRASAPLSTGYSL
jgi:hypothetical protein